jgi:hypothetical protein
LLGLYNRTWLALVVYTQHFTSDLEFSTLRAYGQGLEKLDLALAIEDAFSIKLWYAFNRCAVAARIEIYDFLVGVLEGEDDGVGGKSSKGRMEFLNACQSIFTGGAETIEVIMV